jgi:hypothetical protein
MNAKDSEIEATQLVRKFSIKVSQEMPGNELAQGLGEAEKIRQELERAEKTSIVEWQKWLRFDEPPV